MDAVKVKCVVVGAGPVGALAALYAAKRGWDVKVYEARGDPRDDAVTPRNFTKSISLALSERGINAMHHAGFPNLVPRVMDGSIPMHARMIHDGDTYGQHIEKSQQYDIHGRSIRAVDRTNLNRILLDELDSRPNVQLFFHHKLTSTNLTRRVASFEYKDTTQAPSAQHDGNPREFKIEFDLILGCDGAHSKVRSNMMKFVQMDYEQRYIDVLWCEFTMPPLDKAGSKSPSSLNGFITSPHHLHIWPSSDKMFIAIPNLDKTFTCTLFAPSGDFKQLESTPSSIIEYFDLNFRTAADLIGRSKLQGQFETNPHLPLISIKCSPHHYGSNGVVLGDAAHAMVPFYGQGMNAGLEDVRVLFSFLDTHSSTPNGRAQALEAYTRQRVIDAHTINDLALANYWEMRAGVKSPMYLLRKGIEEFFADKVPTIGFATQYTRVCFSNERYSDVVRAVNRQRRILLAGLLLTTVAILLAVFYWTKHLTGRLSLINGWWDDLTPFGRPLYL